MHRVTRLFTHYWGGCRLQPSQPLNRRASFAIESTNPINYKHSEDCDASGALSSRLTSSPFFGVLAVHRPFFNFGGQVSRRATYCQRRTKHKGQRKQSNAESSWRMPLPRLRCRLAPNLFFDRRGKLRKRPIKSNHRHGSIESSQNAAPFFDPPTRFAHVSSDQRELECVGKTVSPNETSVPILGLSRLRRSSRSATRLFLSFYPLRPGPFCIHLKTLGISVPGVLKTLDAMGKGVYGIYW